jgi:hypothetical protein
MCEACPETSAANLYGQNGNRELTPSVRAPARVCMTPSNEERQELRTMSTEPRHFLVLRMRRESPR